MLPWSEGKPVKNAAAHCNAAAFLWPDELRVGTVMSVSGALCSSLIEGNSLFQSDFDGKYCEHNSDDLDEVAGEKRDDAGCQ